MINMRMKNVYQNLQFQSSFHLDTLTWLHDELQQWVVLTYYRPKNIVKKITFCVQWTKREPDQPSEHIFSVRIRLPYSYRMSHALIYIFKSRIVTRKQRYNNKNFDINMCICCE